MLRLIMVGKVDGSGTAFGHSHFAVVLGRRAVALHENVCEHDRSRVESAARVLGARVYEVLEPLPYDVDEALALMQAELDAEPHLRLVE